MPGRALVAVISRQCVCVLAGPPHAGRKPFYEHVRVHQIKHINFQ